MSSFQGKSSSGLRFLEWVAKNERWRIISNLQTLGWKPYTDGRFQPCTQRAALDSTCSFGSSLFIVHVKEKPDRAKSQPSDSIAIILPGTVSGL